MEISDSEYQEFLKYKKKSYSDTNLYPLSIDWDKLVFRYNPYLSKGQRSATDVKCFAKRVITDKGTNVQLQFWYGKTIYNFTVLDATEDQAKYNRLKNIIDVRGKK